jgi:hypothetical protein
MRGTGEVIYDGKIKFDEQGNTKKEDEQMTERKQIKEMAEAIFKNCHCGLFFSEAEKIADFVINKQGYRKQSEGEWESFPSLGNKYRCSYCKAKVESRTNFCPHCGAKMKGGEDDN